MGVIDEDKSLSTDVIGDDVEDDVTIDELASFADTISSRSIQTNKQFNDKERKSGGRNIASFSEEARE